MFIGNKMLMNMDAGNPGGGVGVQEQVNESTTVAMHTAPDPNAGKSFAIPEAYKDKAYLKDVASMDDVFKKLDGAQSLIGKPRVNFPTDESSDADRMAFNRSAGMPEKADEYEFMFPEGTDRNEEFEKQIKDLFHSAGLSGKAATKVQTGFYELMNKLDTVNQEQADVEFNQLSAEIFGDKADIILADSKKLIEENIPESMQESFKNLPNDALIMMASVLSSIKTKYIDEDRINDKNPEGIAGSGEDDLRKRAMDLRNSPAYEDAFHADNKKVHDELKEIYLQIAKSSK